MKQKILNTITLLALSFLTIIITTYPGRTELVPARDLPFPSQVTSDSRVETGSLNQGIPTSCAIRPETKTTNPKGTTAVVPSQITISRFRKESPQLNPSIGVPNLLQSSNRAVPSYTPTEKIALADPTNYGERFLLDLSGRPAYHEPIVVLHETVGSANSAINSFQTPHPLDSEQVSYHTLISQNGTIIYLVPPDQRAFGAGDSVFEGSFGSEAVKTNPDYPASVNNFAYHVSLETPSDGNNNDNTHSGYTLAQYQSLAWLVAKTGVPDSRITTHKGVDRSGQRKDPRSFNQKTFLELLHTYPRTNEIPIGCKPLSGEWH